MPLESLCRIAPTWSTITLMAWATMSAGKALARDPRAFLCHSYPGGGLPLALGRLPERSAWAARSSAASACSERSRSA